MSKNRSTFVGKINIIMKKILSILFFTCIVLGSLHALEFNATYMRLDDSQNLISETISQSKIILRRTMADIGKGDEPTLWFESIDTKTGETNFVSWFNKGNGSGITRCEDYIINKSKGKKYEAWILRDFNRTSSSSSLLAFGWTGDKIYISWANSEGVAKIKWIMFTDDRSIYDEIMNILLKALDDNVVKAFTFDKEYHKVIDQ